MFENGKETVCERLGHPPGAMTLRCYVSIFFLLVLANIEVQLARGESKDVECQKALPGFLAMPSRQGFDRLSQLGTCWELAASSNANLKQIEAALRQGNRWAARYVAPHLKDLGGGNLEDSLVGLGEFSEHDMVYLLLLRKQGLLSENELSDSLTMLPLSLTDNPRAQLQRLNVRRDKAARVRRPGLSKERDHALSAIDGFASEIRSKAPGIGH